MWFKRAFVSRSSANCVHVRARGALEVGGMGVHKGSWEVRETQPEDHWGQEPEEAVGSAVGAGAGRAPNQRSPGT